MKRAYLTWTARRLCAMGLAALAVATAAADVPRLISYQGKLAGQTTGPVDLTVTFYDDAVAGAVLFTETHAAVPLNNGVFSIQIGSQTVGGVPDGALDASQVWVGVSVDGNPELTPRTQVVMVPYAAKARSSEQLVRPDGFTAVAQTLTNTALSFSPGDWPLMTAGHDNGAGREKRMWIGHSESFPTWGIQYRDLFSDGFLADSIEFVAGDPTKPRFGFELFTGALRIFDGTGSPVNNLVLLDATGSGGTISLYNSAGSSTVALSGGSTGGGSLEVRNAGGFPGVELIGRGVGSAGQIQLYNSLGSRTVSMLGDETDSGILYLFYDDGTTKGIELDVEGTSAEATINMYNASGIETVRIAADEASDGADIALKNAAGVQTCQLDADYAGTGMSRLRVDVVEILGGSDISEQFDIAGEQAAPGTVVCIDPANPGKLVVSRKAYDRTVAGVISGAGGVNPGFLMGQRGSVADGRHPVALTGRVWVHCDASAGAIQPGDLLTTSDTPGHAMKVTDHDKARGAILGKAMTPLAEGRGLVLVLVSLQ